MKLTRTEEALAVLRAGGRVAYRGGTADLFDAAGQLVDAWQTAVKRADQIWHSELARTSTMALAIADDACRADIECYAHFEERNRRPVYDLTRPQIGGKSTPEDDARAVAIAQRAARYIEARGDVFPWRMVRTGDMVGFVEKAQAVAA